MVISIESKCRIDNEMGSLFSSAWFSIQISFIFKMQFCFIKVNVGRGGIKLEFDI